MAPYRLTWLEDGRTLAIGAMVVGPEFGVGDVVYLNTNAVGDGARASRLVQLQLPSPSAFATGGFLCVNLPVAASDGKTVACGGLTAQNAGLPGQRILAAGFGVFSAKTGKLITVRDRQDLHATSVSTLVPDVMWSGPTGSFLVVTDAAVRSPHAVALLAPDGRLRTLPWRGITASDLSPALPSFSW
jgi:hypothetical protein